VIYRSSRAGRRPNARAIRAASVCSYKASVKPFDSESELLEVADQKDIAHDPPPPEIGPSKSPSR
jgi:hypothetical protein